MSVDIKHLATGAAEDFLTSTAWPALDAKVAAIDNDWGKVAAGAGVAVLKGLAGEVIGLLADFGLRLVQQALREEWPLEVVVGKVERVDERG